jgi:hypothetical protein
MSGVLASAEQDQREYQLKVEQFFSQLKERRSANQNRIKTQSSNWSSNDVVPCDPQSTTDMQQEDSDQEM